MSYTQQNFTPGQVLKAEHLNHIEQGIADLDDKVSKTFIADSVIRCKNLFHSWTDGFVVSAMSDPVGTPYPLSIGSCSGFVHLEIGESYILDIRGEETPFAALYYFYDENKNTVPNASGNQSVDSLTKVESGIYKFTATQPYIRANKYATTSEFALIKESEYVKDEPYNYKTIDEAMENIFQEGGGESESANLINSWLDGYIVTPNATVPGDTYAFSGGSCSNFIKLSAQTTYTLDIRGEANPYPIMYCFYDADKNYISHGDYTSFATVADGIYEIYTANSNIAYVRFNKHTETTMFAFYHKSNFVIKPVTVYYALGDSITSGSYSNAAGSGVVADNAEWAYGRQIANAVGCTFVNLGQAGATLNNGIREKVSYVGANATLVTITGGANDYFTGVELGTINDDVDLKTVYGSLKYMVQILASKAPLARIVLISPFIINAGSATINTKWSREYKYSTFTYDELNKAFKDVAEYCNVEYIDGTTQGPTNIYNITSVQKDGIHPTIAFYSTIAAWLQSKLF